MSTTCTDGPVGRESRSGNKEPQHVSLSQEPTRPSGKTTWRGTADGTFCKLSQGPRDPLGHGAAPRMHSSGWESSEPWHSDHRHDLHVGHGHGVAAVPVSADQQALLENGGKRVPSQVMSCVPGTTPKEFCFLVIGDSTISEVNSAAAKENSKGMKRVVQRLAALEGKNRKTGEAQALGPRSCSRNLAPSARVLGVGPWWLRSQRLLLRPWRHLWL